MNKPQFLYHGTSAMVANKALKEGLRPRTAHGQSNWKRTIESNPDAIYLTDAYPLYFALNCDCDTPTVLQIDVSKIDTNWLVPDEDVLEQAGRGYDDVKGNMKQRTRWYRKRLKNYLATDAWLKSLEAMGTCGSLAPIPAEAISRVAFIDYDKAPTLCMTASGPSITLANYRFCGPQYRNLTNSIFGLPIEDDPLNGFGNLTAVPSDEDMNEESKRALQSIIDGRRAYQEQLAADIAAGVRIEEIAA
jgi:hypothetical protein